jgi:hypothetical protein
MDSHHSPLSESASGTFVQERGDLGAYIEGVMPEAPGWQGGSGHLQLLSRLTLGQALGSQLTIGLAEVRTFEALPAWLAGIVALWRVLEDGSHSALLCPSLAFE